MVITITGDNHHQAKAETRLIIDKFVAQHGVLAVERFDAGETPAEQIFDALNATSLLSPKKLVVIDNFETSKELTEHTAEILEQIPNETTALVIIGKLDKRLTYGKLLQKQTDFREFKELAPQEIVGWVVEAAKGKGGKIDRFTAQHLVDCVGADQERLSNELDKLILFAPEITRASIDQLSEREPSSTVFELLDAGFNGHQKQALRLYDEQRRQQMEPLAIVAMISWQLHILAVVKTARDKSTTDIAKDAAIHPFVIQKTFKLANQMSLVKLKELVRHAIHLETTMKSRTINGDDAVRHFLLSLATS